MRAAAYGAVIGALAAVFKLLRPLHEVSAPSEIHVANVVLEIVGAALAFALLCAGASALRNFIARRLIWPEIR